MQRYTKHIICNTNDQIQHTYVHDQIRSKHHATKQYAYAHTFADEQVQTKLLHLSMTYVNVHMQTQTSTCKRENDSCILKYIHACSSTK